MGFALWAFSGVAANLRTVVSKTARASRVKISDQTQTDQGGGSCRY